MASPKPKRRWYQFSLKTLLWVMAATCSIVFVGAMACGMYCLGISHTESVMRSHVNRLAPVIQKINSGEMPPPNDANRAEFWMADVDLPLCGLEMVSFGTTSGQAEIRQFAWNLTSRR